MIARKAIVSAIPLFSRINAVPASRIAQTSLSGHHQASCKPRSHQLKCYSSQSPWSSETHSGAEDSSGPRKYSFEDIQARLSTTPQPQDTPAAKPLIVVDVREPAELAATGRIPGAYNVPIGSAPDGLFLPPDEFEARWGFEKPKEGDEVVFYCKAGVRSRAAAGMVSGTPGGGWEGVRVGEFPGSWIEWEGKGGPVEK